MRKRLVYRLGSLGRLPLDFASDLGLAIHDVFLDTVLGPTPMGSRREIRRWSKTVKRIDRLERSIAGSSSKKNSEQLRFSIGKVASHLLEMNRKAGKASQSRTTAASEN